MIKEYECPTCGYVKAKWHIVVGNRAEELCENCYKDYTSRTRRVRDFNLNRKSKRKK